MKIPALTTAQMAEVDRLMIEEYGILLIQMMENAGQHLAEMANRMLGGQPAGQRVVVLCGRGSLYQGSGHVHHGAAQSWLVIA
jgi:NAD(P)H-hydrate epimerase